MARSSVSSLSSLPLTLNLQGAKIPHADLSFTNLSNANLKFADLSFVNLKGADLKNTQFEGADLHGADLSDASNLTRQQLEMARIDKDTKLPKYITENLAAE